MIRVLVTGAAGFVGSWLAEGCLARGWKLVGVDALTDSSDTTAKRRNAAWLRSAAGARFIEADLLEVDLEPLLDGTDVIFHLAGETGVRGGLGDFDRYLERNVHATQRLLHAAGSVRTGRLVVASSSSVYGDHGSSPAPESALVAPTSLYGASKAMAELLVRIHARSQGLEAIVLRYFTTYGPRQRPDMLFARAIDAALTGSKLWIFGDGEQSRDFIHVRDVAAATIAAAEHGRPGATYNIGTGTSVSVRDALGLISSLTGAEIPVVHVEADSREARATCADATLMRGDLGFEPSFELDTGLLDQVAWHRARCRAVGVK